MSITEINDLSLRTLEYKTVPHEKIENIILFLHGLGSNAEDLISLAPMMAEKLPNSLFLSVDAPEPCDMAAFGYQWFSLQSRNPENILQGLQKTKPIINQYLEEIRAKFNIENNKIALVGFSQGTMTALYNALAINPALACVLGYSGALFLDPDNSDNLTKLPIMLVHGTMDDVVPYQSLELAKNTLMAKGFDIKTVSCENLGHSIDEKGLNAGIEFLNLILYEK